MSAQASSRAVRLEVSPRRRSTDGLAYGYLTPAVKTRTLEKIQELVAEAQIRGDALTAANHDALITVATAIYEKRRLSDERLDEVLVAAGFTLPRTTA